ncbi:MAG: hypothetical protein LBS70_09840 [Candidatus Accumulibacter sp.]|jgi:hypothetical protein|nr:hypothetical protein [Accumulibacter sp.]
MIDPMKFRREHLRWLILLALNHGRPSSVVDALILSAARADFPDCTMVELQREADYLKDRGLITVNRPPDNGHWMLDLTRAGVDLVEYTVDCEPGIGRPEKYW